MKILFLNVNRNITGSKIFHPAHPLPPIDIGYCASVLDQNGHSTHLLDTEVTDLNSKIIVDYIRKNNIESVVMKPHISVAKHAIEIAKVIKENFSDMNIICFGPSMSYETKRFLFENSPIDLGVMNEPEYTLRDYFKNKDRNVDGLAYFDGKLKINKSRELIENLDELPIPKHEFFLNNGYNIRYPLDSKGGIKSAFMLTSRGCPFSCVFCSPIDGRAAFGNSFRFRSPKNVVDEIEYLVSKGANAFYFMDDIFVSYKQRVREICDLIVERGLKITWSTQTRVDTIDEEIAQKMKDAGCYSLCFGIESGSERVLKILNKKADIPTARKAIKIINDVGIKPVGFFMIGNPTETEEEIKQTLDLSLELPFYMMQVSFFTPFKGSPVSENFDYNQNINKYDMDSSPQSSLNNIDTEILKKYQSEFYKKFYFRLHIVGGYVKKIFSSPATFKNEFKFLVNSLRYMYGK